ncbi:MAG: gluconate transporter [Bacteroidetes bacterium]|nr:MAG: gluconate transporter [Bacteroidota bacterium]
MSASLIQITLSLVVGIALIVVLTTRFRIHAFFALMLACFLVGICVQMPFPDIIKSAKEGFGNIMQSLGWIIVLGTTLGVILEHTGCTIVMAESMLKLVGEKYAAFAMSMTGFVVGLPIFCDSGYIVLSGLNDSLARRTKTPMVIMAASLATGLYSVHCLIPPHPGAAAAAGIIGVDFGRLITYGIIVAIPCMLTGYIWTKFSSRKLKFEESEKTETVLASRVLPKVSKAFVPVIVPILLIAIRSFFSVEKINGSGLVNFFSILGEPVIALSIGIVLAIISNRKWENKQFAKLLQDAAEKAGGILVIIGAGGSFGGVLAATHLGDHFSNLNVGGYSALLLFPFLLTALLKTAQGSSTVAIITASSILAPLLPTLGIVSDNQKLLCVLAMGAGSMVISHANDAYFWVITKFSRIEMRPMLRVYTLATIWMGIVGLITVYILSLLLK